MRVLRGQRPTYKILELLGEGLTGRVYKALRLDSQYGTHQEVAVKVLKSKNQVSLLRNEFTRLEKVESSHCVKLLGWENLPQGPALVLEYLEGMNLLDLSRRVKLKPGLIREIIAQTQFGLRDLEEQGLFHGDLSLKNIYVTNRGQIKLIDFGCGTADGALLGNPLFMAPELHKTLTPNLKSDLFSLGMIELYLQSQEIGLVKPDEAFDRSILLCKDPRRREFKPVRSQAKMKKVLSSKVCSALVSIKDRQNTQLLGAGASDSKPKFRVLSVAAVVFLVFVTAPWPNFRTQFHQKKQNSSKASIYIDKLRPGIYQWRWSKKHGGGESRILLRSGESLGWIGNVPRYEKL